MKVHIAVIAIHEEPYIFEFIDHYVNIGVTKIYLYDNSPSATLAALQDLPHIHYVHFPGLQQQMPAYNHAITQSSHQNSEGPPDFLGFVDVDEFLVLGERYTKIQDFLAQFQDFSAVGIPWKLFDSNGLIEYDPRPVQERFTYGKMHSHFKSFIRPHECISFNNPHYFITQCGTRNAANTKTLLSAEDYCDHDFESPILNHYFTKSYREFITKIKRGRSDISSIRKFSEFFL